jgi:glycosyltransferase involved in cell wall biosynthesis
MGEGVPQHVMDVLAGIDLDRFDVDVACPRASTLWRGLAGRDRLRLHEIAADRAPSPRDARTFATLAPLVRRADVVHAHSAKAGFLARLAARLQGRSRRCVFTPHAWSFWAAHGARRRLYEGLERRAAHWCHTILVVSEHEREAGLAAGIGRPAQYRVVPNGIDLERFSAPPDPVPGRVLMLGRLSAQKRPDLAVQAFALARRGRDGAELHLVGDGPWRERTEALVRELGVGGSVRFLGLADDVPALLARAACVILSSDYEGCPLSVIEAMAAGVPVVATRVGGVPELLGDGRSGLVVEPGSAEELAGALGILLDDPARARALGAEARREAQARLSRGRMAAGVLAVYEQIARDARA